MSDEITLPATFTPDTNTFDLSVFLGLGNMGFKLGIDYSPASLSVKVDNVDAGTDDAEYRTSSNDIMPYAAWGMSLDLNGHAFTPYAEFAFGFSEDKTEVVRGTTTSSTADSYNYMGLTAGAGYKFDNDGELTQSISGEISYTGRFFPKVTSNINGTATTQDKTYASFTLTPGYKLTWTPAEPIRFGLSASLPITLTPNSNTNVKSNAFTLTPDIAGAMQWQITPEKATLNVGAGINLGNLVTTSSSNDGKDTSASFFGGVYGTTLATGLTFNLTKNVQFDTSFNIVSTFNTTSLATIWNTPMRFQLSVKF